MLGHDTAAVLALLVVTLAYYSPALFKGLSFGPFDLMSTWPLTHSLWTGVHNPVSADQIQQNAPWYYLDWTLVHRGEFPLWNQYVLLGMPNFLNFQSAVLSLPTLISYAFPASSAYLVITIITSIIAGTGAYTFARSMQLSPLPALMTGLTFELSGAIINWAGWTLGTASAWIGWILAFSYLLLVSPKCRRQRVTLLALSVAFALYAGHPESCIIIAVTAVCFLTVTAFHRLVVRQATLSDLLHFLLLEAAGGGLGALLAAPLWLPAVQLVAVGSKTATHYSTHPASALANILVPNYFGRPTYGWVFPTINYYEVACWVGPLAVVFALTSIFVNYRRPQILGLAATAILSIAVSFDVDVLPHLINDAKPLGTINFSRCVIPLTLCLAMLAGDGVNVAFNAVRQRRAEWALLGATGAVLGVLAVIMVAARASTNTVAQATVHFSSFASPLAALAALLLIEPLRRASSAQARAAAIMLLLAVQVGLLMQASIANPSYSSQFFPETQSMQLLRTTVGDGLVGTLNQGTTSDWSSLGYLPEVNSAYGVRQFAAYDPMLPRVYHASWEHVTGGQRTEGVVFSPSIDNQRVALIYGVNYVLGPAQGTWHLAPGADGGARAATRDMGTTCPQCAPALLLLLRTYLNRPDVEASFPWSDPNSVQKVLSWAVQWGTLTDTDLSAYKSELQSLSSFVHAHPLSSQVIHALIEEAAPPVGFVLIATTAEYRLYYVPGANQFTLTNGSGNIDGQGVISAVWSNNYTVRLHVETTHADTLIARITNVPGWHAKVNGRDVQLRSWNVVMQQIPVPAGSSVVTLTYWPPLLTTGFTLASGAAISLLLMWPLELLLRRRGSQGERKRDEGEIANVGASSERALSVYMVLLYRMRVVWRTLKRVQP